MTADKIKDRIRERDGYCCTKCGMTNDEHKQRFKGRYGGFSLNVHRPDELAPYSLDNGITLCWDCHMGEHSHRPLRTARGYTGHSSKRTRCVGPIWFKPEDYARLKEAAAMDGLPLTQFLINSVFNDDGTLTSNFLEILSEST